MAKQATYQTKPAAQASTPAKAKPRDPVAAGERDAAQNRSAGHNYFLMDRFEAGVALRGSEVKSIREGKANLKDSYGLVKNGEAFLLNAHIGAYSHGSFDNHDAVRTRKLLLHTKGLTLIPTRLYFRRGRVKCEIAVAKGKQDWDKRATERKREADNEARAAVARSKSR
jgi:SsrA-binding protein